MPPPRLGTRRGAALGPIAALALLCGCGPDPGTSATDAGLSDGPRADGAPAGGPTILLGTGEDALVPLAHGDVLPLWPGIQGSQHVFVSLRLSGLDAPRATFRVRLLRKRDGRAVTGTYVARLPLSAAAGGGFEIVGLVMVVDEPALGLGETCVLAVSAEDPAGLGVASGVAVVLAWGGPALKDLSEGVVGTPH